MIALYLMLGFITILAFSKFDSTNKAKYMAIGIIGLLLFICLFFIGIVKEI